MTDYHKAQAEKSVVEYQALIENNKTTEYQQLHVEKW